jgi:hypothetical protein
MSTKVYNFMYVTDVLLIRHGAAMMLMRASARKIS